MNDLGTGDLVAVIGQSMGRVLALPPLAAVDDFFGSGGDSYRAMRVLSELVERFGPHDVMLAERLHEELVLAMFDDSTPVALAAVIGKY